jgi:Fe-S-cluster containining protein
MMQVFECKMCGECCYGQGGIYLEDGEADKVAEFLGVDLSHFLSNFCETRNHRLYLKTGSNHFCIFFDPEKSCLIHSVKPQRCALWPFFPAIVAEEQNWEMAKDACPGIHRDCSFDDFVKQSRLHTRDNPA